MRLRIDTPHMRAGILPRTWCRLPPVLYTVAPDLLPVRPTPYRGGGTRLYLFAYSGAPLLHVGLSFARRGLMPDSRSRVSRCRSDVRAHFPLDASRSAVAWTVLDSPLRGGQHVIVVESCYVSAVSYRTRPFRIMPRPRYASFNTALLGLNLRRQPDLADPRMPIAALGSLAGAYVAVATVRYDPRTVPARFKFAGAFRCRHFSLVGACSPTDDPFGRKISRFHPVASPFTPIFVMFTQFPGVDIVVAGIAQVMALQTVDVSVSSRQMVSKSK